MTINLGKSVFVALTNKLDDKIYLLPSIMYEPSLRCLHIYFLDRLLYMSVRNKKRYESLNKILDEIRNNS